MSNRFGLLEAFKSVEKIAALLALAFVLPALAADGHDSDVQAGSTANSRYVVNGGEVYDTKTNLTWQRCSVGQRWDDTAGCVGIPEILTWDDAMHRQSEQQRLPTIDELKTIIKPMTVDDITALGDPKLRANRPPRFDIVAFQGINKARPMLEFWSSSPAASDAAWGVDFKNGQTVGLNKQFRFYVRLVRTGH